VPKIDRGAPPGATRCSPSRLSDRESPTNRSPRIVVDHRNPTAGHFLDSELPAHGGGVGCAEFMRILLAIRDLISRPAPSGGVVSASKSLKAIDTKRCIRLQEGLWSRQRPERTWSPETKAPDRRLVPTKHPSEAGDREIRQRPRNDCQCDRSCAEFEEAALRSCPPSPDEPPADHQGPRSPSWRRFCLSSSRE